MAAESLLPGTDAIPKGQIESTRYRGKFLIRYRNMDGYTTQRIFESADESHDFFLICIERLKREIEERRSQISNFK